MYTPTLTLSTLPHPLPSFPPARPFRPIPKNRNSIRQLSLPNLARLPLFTHSPEEHIPEILLAYEQIREDLPAIRARMAGCQSAEEVEYAKLFGDARREKTFAQWQVLQSLVLTIALFLNVTLVALELARDVPWPLAEESTLLVEEILALSRSMTHLRPLFSTGILNPLFLAWAVETDSRRLAELEEMLAVYLEDKRMDERRGELFSGGVWFREHFRRLKGRTLRSLKLGEDEGEKGSLKDVKEEPMPVVGNCTIL
jgi:hypothetical protein